MKAAWATGEYSYTQIAAHFGVHFSTVGRSVRKVVGCPNVTMLDLTLAMPVTFSMALIDTVRTQIAYDYPRLAPMRFYERHAIACLLIFGGRGIRTGIHKSRDEECYLHCEFTRIGKSVGKTMPAGGTF